MPLLSNKAAIAMKAETVKGTAVTVEDADYDLAVYDVSVTPTVEFDDDAAKFLSGDFGRAEAVPGKQTMEISGYIKYKWGGAVDTAPTAEKILNMAGFAKELYTTFGIGYQDIPCGSDNDTYTVQYYIPKAGCNESAYSFKMAGCALSAGSLSAENVGGSVRLNFTIKGKVVSVGDTVYADIPVLDEANLDSALPERLMNTSVSILGNSAKVGTFELDFGITLTEYENQNETSGVDYYVITERNPTLSLDPYMELAADGGSWWTEITTPTTGEVTMVFDTNHLTIFVPRAQIMSPGVADREGLSAWDLNIRFLRNGTTSELIPDNASFELLQGARA